MDRIKTYVLGLANGFHDSFKRLDEMVAEDPDLSGVEIKSVEDRYFIVAGKTHDTCRGGEECLSRIVLYRKKRSTDG